MITEVTSTLVVLLLFNLLILIDECEGDRYLPEDGHNDETV